MKYKSVEPFILGGLSSCNAEIFTFPIDFVKTRLQLQGQKSDNLQIKYRGMFDCFGKVFREEGLFAFYSGIKPALLRQATYGTLKLGFYHQFKRVFCGPNNENQTFLKNITFGMISGALANGMANPTDVLKVRMQSNQNLFANKSLMSSFAEIYKQEGFGGLYRGVIPNAQRAAVITGIELSTYDSFKQFLITNVRMQDNTFTHFAASLMAGFCASIAATPIDVIKTRLMNQRKLVDPSQNKDIYKGSIDCFIKTVKNEGALALYRGFIPSYLRLGPWNIIFFLTYEKIKF